MIGTPDTEHQNDESHHQKKKRKEQRKSKQEELDEEAAKMSKRGEQEDLFRVVCMCVYLSIARACV